MTLDNVEHLYFTGTTGGGNLAAGTYALIITGDPSRTANIGLSYDAIAVPEPTACLAAFGLAVLTLTRRRRSA